MHRRDIRTAGKKLGQAEKVLIMLHGRGALAEDILGLAPQFSVKEFALLAPQATGYSWYPYSFLAPPKENEPWLSSALGVIHEIVDEIHQAGVTSGNIFFCGFSQGACLTLEFVTRHARKWGGIAAFTGGLIGDRVYPDHYKGDFERTHVFIGSGSPDPHVPVERVHETARRLEAMNAQVTKKIYPGIGHAIVEDEIALADQWVFGGT